MRNTNTSTCRTIKTHNVVGKKKYGRQSIFIPLMLIPFLFNGCLGDPEQDLNEAFAEYAREHKEELVLFDNLQTYFEYPEVADGEYLSPSKTMSPLYGFLVKMTKNKQPVFTPTTTVIHFHYPMDFKEITSEERVLISVSEIGYAPQAHKPGALRSSLNVIERDNENKTGVIYAQCRFLLQIYDYPPGTDSEIGNFVWLFCRCTWDAEKQAWKVSNIRRLSDGEAILDHY